MNSREKVILVIAGIVFLTLQWEKLTQPLVGEFEAGFQEMIALHHLESGIVANRFLPVIAEISGEKFYHSAHPPLLHIIYALLYRTLGVKEWVTRGFCLLLLFASIFFLSQLLSPSKRLTFWLIALFFPICFRLGFITNYEPLTLFSICFFLFCFKKIQNNFSLPKLVILILSLLLLLLSDWPGYLVLPALFLLYFREQKTRKILAGLFILELIIFGGLISYLKFASGELALVAHSQTRSNPIYLLQFNTYAEFFAHLKWILGKPTLVLVLLSLFALLINSQTRREWLVQFWFLFLALLWLSASNLVSRHWVYLLYFFPFGVLALTQGIHRSHSQRLALAVILLSFIFPDYRGLKTKDARFYYLAKKLKNLNAEKPQKQSLLCFSSAALGTLYYYAKIETVVPITKKATESLRQLDYDILILDAGNPEVENLKHLISRADYQLHWEFKDLLVYLKTKKSEHYLARPKGEKKAVWWNPETEVIYVSREAFYGFKQPPGPEKISVVKSIAQGNCFDFSPMIFSNRALRKGDGVNFVIIGEKSEQRHLLFARFLPPAKSASKFFHPVNAQYLADLRYQIYLNNFNQLWLITEAGPRGDYSYDDAYWLEPIYHQECAGG